METTEAPKIEEKVSDITFEEFKEKKEQAKIYKCKKCKKEYRSRGSCYKHEKKCNEPFNEPPVEPLPVINLEEDPKLEALKYKLRQLVLTNPKFDLTKEITLNKDLAKIDKMEADEIKMRIADFQRNASVKLDKKVSRTALDITAFAIGSILDITEELKQEFEKDELLQESVNDVLSAEFLCFIDPKIKMAGLMAMDTGNAYVKSLPRKNARALQLKREKEFKIKLEEAQEDTKEKPEEEKQTEQPQQ